MNSRPRTISVLPLLPAVALLSFPFEGVTIGAAHGAGRLPEPIEGTPAAPPERSEIFDLDALEHTRTFCVDMNHMESSEAAEVKEFLAKESGPKKLLGHLPWQLVDDCTKADAVARIYFERADIREEMYSPAGFGATVSVGYGLQSVLVLYDKASIRLFYRAEGRVFHKNADLVLGSPFAMLAKDLKRINR